MFTSDAFRFSRWMKSLPLILQSESAECGMAALAMIANYHGHDLELIGLRQRFSLSLKGVTLSRLMSMASELGFLCRPLKLELEQLKELATPCILHWDLNHFVVLRKATAAYVVIHDPGFGIRKLSLKEVSEHFTGIALELTPSANFQPVVDRRVVTLRGLTSNASGLAPALTQILLFALALEVFALLSPFYLQWIVDQVVVSGDHDLLTLLGLAFLSFAVLSSLITAARGWAVTSLSANLNVQWASNLFSHLMRLPLEWFERRHVSDVVSRFGSIQTIQKSLTTQFVGTMLDGLMSVVTLVVMCFYDLRLTAIVFALFGIYCLARVLFFRPLKRASEQQIVYGARQQGELLESIRGAMPIMLADKQNERLVRYSNATVAFTNRDVRVQQLGIAFALTNQLLFGTGRVALIWLAATLALKNEFSIGMLIAFVSYADQFTNRSVGLIDKCVDFKMLRVHTERISDIALSAPESTRNSYSEPLLRHIGLELRNVSFRYGDGEPWVIRNCSAVIAPGESIALVGASGCGKTTLAKILLGLLTPVEGSVLFGGVDIKHIGLSAYRRMVGAVMQDDQLFAGSIAENINFFDASASSINVEAAARLAVIHDDIVAMPMGYHSLVGDMGSSLSGGQKQRIILARALYRRPRLLVLDEATSHLDLDRERLISAAINRLATTRIVIAHRPETIAGAKRIIALHNGEFRFIAKEASPLANVVSRIEKAAIA